MNTSVKLVLIALLFSLWLAAFAGGTLYFSKAWYVANGGVVFTATPQPHIPTYCYYQWIVPPDLCQLVLP